MKKNLFSNLIHLKITFKFNIGLQGNSLTNLDFTISTFSAFHFASMKNTTGTKKCHSPKFKYLAFEKTFCGAAYNEDDDMTNCHVFHLLLIFIL